MNTKFEDQLCHPVNFQPDTSVSYFSRFSKSLKNIESNFFHFMKVKFSYLLSFVDPDKFYHGSFFF